MTTALAAPLEAYVQRAGLAAAPEGLIEAPDTANHLALAAYAAVSTTFYADISEFQNYLDSSYPYPVIALRLDTGWRIDYHVATNYSRAAANSKIKVVICYIVFIPGQRAAILARAKKFFAGRSTSKLVMMIDMESGSGFAGPGNHSTEANGLASDFANWLGSTKRVVGYANHYDFGSNWPSRPSWLKLITASYGTSNPGTWGWQYYGGLDYATPGGYPRSCPPFGGWVDMNVIHRTISQIVADCFPAPKPPAPKPPAPKPKREKDMLFYQVDRASVPKGVAWPGVFTKGDGKPEYVIDNESAAAIGINLGIPYNVNMPKVSYVQHMAWMGATAVAKATVVRSSATAPSGFSLGLGDKLLSFIRTAVPAAVGTALTWLAAQLHIVVDPNTELALGGLCVLVLTTAYYTLARLLEAKFSWASLLLGSPPGTQPIYATKTSDGISVITDLPPADEGTTPVT